MIKCEITYFILSKQHQGVTVWGWLKIREGKKKKLAWCQYLSHGSGVSFWKKTENEVPYFLLQKVQSWPCWLWGLYHFYLACQEKSNVPNPIKTNKKNPKNLKSSGTAGGNAKKHAVGEAVITNIILFVKNFVFCGPWKIQNTGESRKIKMEHNRACKACCSTHSINSAGQAVAVDISWWSACAFLMTFICGKYVSLFCYHLSSLSEKLRQLTYQHLRCSIKQLQEVSFLNANNLLLKTWNIPIKQIRNCLTICLHWLFKQARFVAHGKASGAARFSWLLCIQMNCVYYA